MKAQDNYKKMLETEAKTSPLPKEEHDIPTRSIPIDPDAPDEPIDKAQIEAEVDVEKHGVPVIDVERPPVPEVNTDPTPYKKVGVKRKEKRSDKTPKKTKEESISLKEDREMMAYAEKLKIPKRKSIFAIISKKLYELSCKTKRFALNRQRKKYLKTCEHYHEDHKLPDDVQSVPLEDVDEVRGASLGRARGFKREEDRTSNTVQMIRNKKTGVVVATPQVLNYKDAIKDKEGNADDYEVVESKIKG